MRLFHDLLNLHPFVLIVFHSCIRFGSILLPKTAFNDSIIVTFFISAMSASPRDLRLRRNPDTLGPSLDDCH